MTRGTPDRILVAGAGGFIGRALVERLEKRGPVLKLGRKTCDLRDPDQTRKAVLTLKPRSVFVLTGDARLRDWDGLWASHVIATSNLLEALHASGHPVKVVIASSSAEYGAADGKIKAKETDPCFPVSLYGSSKLAQTLLALSYSRGPMQVLAARIFNVIGPDTPEHLAPGAFARQIARIKDGLQPPELVTGNLEARRDYLDVRDVASALDFLMRRGAAGEIYNVGSGRSLPMSSVLKGMLAASRTKARVTKDPARMRPSEVADLRADGRKLAALGWAPRVPLSRSLADAVASRRGA